ncbi:MAG: hypothetical protein QM705_15820 [Ancrocorticia sp.]
MIISRGWGILAFISIGLSIYLTTIFAEMSGVTMATLTWQAIPAFFIGGLAVFLFGRHVNLVRPTRIFSHNRAVTNGYVVPSLDGTYSPLPLEDQPPLNAAEIHLLKRHRNRHTLFWIPMQWWGLTYPLLGLGITIVNTQ